MNLAPRFHQNLFIRKTIRAIEDGKKQFLWGWKCRSGKTYGIGGLILAFNEAFNAITTTLIITPAPTETLPQFTNDLFRRFADFDDYNIIEIKNGKQFKNIELESGVSNIIIVSKQTLDNYVDENKVELGQIDLIIFDENHFGGTTDNSIKILETYGDSETVKLYLTATYQKPLRQWAIDNAFFWDIEDEQLCKRRDVEKLREKHQLMEDLLPSEEELAAYDIMPELYIISSTMDSGKLSTFQCGNDEQQQGFSMDSLFSLESKDAFQYPEQVKQVLEYIAGDYIFGRIANICDKQCSRRPLTQLWFLPFGRGMHIEDVSVNLCNLMMKNDVLKCYDILIINSKNKLHDLKIEIARHEELVHAAGKSGLILLAGNQCSLGITLPNVDVIMLLNNTTSSDRIMQMMYRCMSEAENKKYGFVVDLNMSRVLNTVLDYNTGTSGNSSELGVEDKIRYIVENNLIHIDDDLLQAKDNKSAVVERLLEIWRANPTNCLTRLMKKIEDIVLDVETNDQRSLDSDFAKSKNDSSLNKSIKFDEENHQDIASGKIVHLDQNCESESNPESEPENNAKPGKESEQEDGENKEAAVRISLSKDILPFVIPLCCVLTINNDETNLFRMIATIAADRELVEPLNEQAKIWWDYANSFAFLSKIIAKYVRPNSDIINIALQCKMTIKASIDKPMELLEYLDSCLKPKKIEKRKYGEVFTPMSMVNEMLDRLDKYYTSKHGHSIFEEADFTWFDPANGMGNYMVGLYFKLMEGLRKRIPNEEKRRRHILEKMLYMAELNKKNVFVSRQILNPGGKYRLNLYQGDSLKLDTGKVFGIDRFSVVIGNPPYNEAFNKSGAKPLYNKFIEKYIDRCQFLTFITGSRWFSGGKGLDKFRKDMLQRKDLVYIRHFRNASEIFGRNVSIEGGVNYFLKDADYRGLVDYNGMKLDLSKYDILVESQYYGLLDKLTKLSNITSIFHGSSYFGIQTNDKRLIDDPSNVKSRAIKCYVSQQKGFVKYIDEKNIKKDFNFWKVITARANGGNGCFGNMFIGKPNEVYSQSYICFGTGTSQSAAKSLQSYLRCRLPNLMLSLRKISQDISEDTCKWIPMVPLDREWTDAAVYKWLKLSNDDIALVEAAKIIGYVPLKKTMRIKIKKTDNKIDNKIEPEAAAEKTMIKIKVKKH